MPWGSLGSPPGPEGGGSTALAGLALPLVRRRRVGAPRCPAAGSPGRQDKVSPSAITQGCPHGYGLCCRAVPWVPPACDGPRGPAPSHALGDLGDRGMSWGQSSGGTRGFAGGSSMKFAKGKGRRVLCPGAGGEAGRRHSSAGGTWVGVLSTSQQRALAGVHNVKGMLRGLLFTTKLVEAGRCVLGGEAWCAGGVWAGGPRCSPPQDRCWHRAARGGFRRDTRKKFFTVRVVRCWSRLPSTVVDVLCLAALIICFSFS